jgi:hypothetical protein
MQQLRKPGIKIDTGLAVTSPPSTSLSPQNFKPVSDRNTQSFSSHKIIGCNRCAWCADFARRDYRNPSHRSKNAEKSMASQLQLIELRRIIVPFLLYSGEQIHAPTIITPSREEYLYSNVTFLFTNAMHANSQCGQKEGSTIDYGQ